ncbi:MAG: hypothetical protein JNL34_02415 [Anaerolineae bacterium]|nr:hypothetical protein [Anaerolineae bacterium]
MKKFSLLLVLVALLVVAGAALAQGPVPSWFLTQGAPNTCSSTSGFSLNGVEVNIPSGQASESGVLSAPGNPSLGFTNDDAYGPNVGTLGGFFVFVSPPYSLPANTPLTLSVTTFFGTNQTGGVSYVSTITWDCTTGVLIVVAPPAAAQVCNNPLPDGSVVGDAPGGAQVYWQPAADKNSGGVVLNPGSYWVVGFDETGEYAQVWLTCDTQLLWIRADTIGPSANAPWNGRPLPTRIVG